MNRLFKNISYSFIANISGTLVSMLVSFLVPKFIGTVGYGYLQLYIFYTGYIGFFHLGWVDGIYLRYGGQDYGALDIKRFSAQFQLFSLIEILIGLVIGILGYLFGTPAERVLVFCATGAAVIFYLPKTMLAYILQCTNRIKEFAVSMLIEKLLFFGFSVVLMVLGVKDFFPYVLGDLLGKAVSLGYTLVICRSLVLKKGEPFSGTLAETWENIRAGISLMFANIASGLIIGIVRFAIERSWDVATFGKVSLTISVSNMFIVCINAIALVLFPTLKRVEEDRLADIYRNLSSGILYVLFGLLVLYYPAKVILSLWLPEFADSLGYLAILFPLCAFESKMNMAVGTLMKVLRREKQLFLVNLCSVVLSLLVTLVSVLWLHQLDLTMISIVFLVGFRCILAEILLAKVLHLSPGRQIAEEVLLSAIFIATSWYVGGLAGIGLYLAAYLIYLLMNKNHIKGLLAFVKAGRGKGAADETK